jgi:hypothetical protein
MSSKAAMPKSLKQKMAASVAGTGQSLVPSTPTPPPPEEDLVPSIDMLLEDTDERATLRQLIGVQVQLNSDKKSLEKRLDPINERIKTILSNNGIEKTVCDGASITYFAGSRSTINRLKLIAFGIDEVIIEKCTDTTVTHTLKITPARL